MMMRTRGNAARKVVTMCCITLHSHKDEELLDDHVLHDHVLHARLQHALTCLPDWGLFLVETSWRRETA